MTTAVTELQTAQIPTSTACAWTGVSRATLYRRAARAAASGASAGAGSIALDHGQDTVPDALGDTAAAASTAAAVRGRTSQSLSEDERTHARALLTRPEYADLSIGQLWVRELDEGRYPCSLSTLYRIARSEGMTRERRRQATHPPRVVPELVADAPSQVWTWDITKLRGPHKGKLDKLQPGDHVHRLSRGLC